MRAEVISARLRTVLLTLAAVVLQMQGVMAQPAQGSASAAVCTYNNLAYSEGAAICPQARLMLTCSSESSRLVWKIVSDPALSARCTTPTAAPERVSRRRAMRQQRVAPASPPPVAGPAAKCFVFNGRQYCE